MQASVAGVTQSMQNLQGQGELEPDCLIASSPVDNDPTKVKANFFEISFQPGKKYRRYRIELGHINNEEPSNKDFRRKLITIFLARNPPSTLAVWALDYCSTIISVGQLYSTWGDETKPFPSSHPTINPAGPTDPVILLSIIFEGHSRQDRAARESVTVYQAKTGFFTSIRPGENKLLLNANTITGAFLPDGAVLQDWIWARYNLRYGQIPAEGTCRGIKGLKVTFELLNPQKQWLVYAVSGRSISDEGFQQTADGEVRWEKTLINETVIPGFTLSPLGITPAKLFWNNFELRVVATQLIQMSPRYLPPPTLQFGDSKSGRDVTNLAEINPGTKPASRDLNNKKFFNTSSFKFQLRIIRVTQDELRDDKGIYRGLYRGFFWLHGTPSVCVRPKAIVKNAEKGSSLGDRRLLGNLYMKMNFKLRSIGQIMLKEDGY
ncbi:hypothetical protein BDZ45DRAFT_694785 [Acephala macrosclerotiorum]|nr:hypothetical protein BDZ45DRAFT_694785 [Acephala macrosclerotiorum]